jgi:hypothetical protein
MNGSSVFGRYSGVRTIGPRNQGFSKTTQATLDQVISRANQQFENALEVDGTDIAVWTHSERGRRCTCMNLAPQQSLFSDVAPPAVVNMPAKEDFQEKPDILTFQIRGGKGKAQQRQNPEFSGTYDSKDKGSKAPIVQLEELDVHEQTLENGTQELSDVLALLGAGDDSGFLFGGDRTPCGICFGTGYVEGYDLLNGHRYVLDASNTQSFTTSGFTVNHDDFPYSFTSEYYSPNYVVWSNVELPTYFTSVMAIHVRNNIKPAESALVEFSLDSTTWNPLTVAALSARNGLATKIDIRVRPDVTQMDGLFKFTHIEFVYQFAPYFRGQVPPETPSWSDISKARALVNSTVSLSSKVPALSTFDIIFVAKTNSLYKVNDVTNFLTSKRQNMGTNTAGIRLLQSYEITTLLRLAFDPVIVKSFTGLEHLQGSLIYADNDIVNQANAGTTEVIPPVVTPETGFAFDVSEFG